MGSGELNWASVTIAIVGGDKREQEIARLAAETGADVRAFGFPWPDGGIVGVKRAESAAEAVRGARYLLLPIPAPHPDGSLYAEGVSEPIFLSEELLSELAPGAHLFGWTEPRDRDLATGLGIHVHDYHVDEELMQLRAPAICEGAIQLAVENTDRTLHASKLAVVGFGNIGRQLAQTLLAMGGDVHVVARNPLQRAAAYALGATPVPLTDLTELAPEMVAIFSTVPAQVVDREVMGKLMSDALVVDLAATPGSVDREAAEQLGVKMVWARGLGKRAPITVGASQWYGIRKRIELAESQT